MERSLGLQLATHSLDELYRKTARNGNAATVTAGLARVARCQVEALRRLASGVAVVLDGKLLCVDIFSSPQHFRMALPMIAASYALEARATTAPAQVRRAAPTAAGVAALVRGVLNERATASRTEGGVGFFAVRGPGLRGTVALFGRGQILRAELFGTGHAVPQKAVTTPGGRR